MTIVKRKVVLYILTTHADVVGIGEYLQKLHPSKKEKTETQSIIFGSFCNLSNTSIDTLTTKK